MPNSRSSEDNPQSNHPTGQPNAKESGATPSGAKGDNPSTAGPGKSDVISKTPENALGHLNPSAPEDSNVTPGSTSVK